MPGFVTTARNTWTVTALGGHRSTVSLRARLDTRGLLGLLGRWIILAQVRSTNRTPADDLRHYVESGTPSPGKQGALRRIKPHVQNPPVVPSTRQVPRPGRGTEGPT
jgi:hypothetical protein